MSNSSQHSDGVELGVFSRSLLWFAQSAVLGGGSWLVGRYYLSDTVAPLLSIVASFFVVFLLFRHIDAMIERRLD
jgi:ABC-type protease/lipase transport system fused ATPase/permease subunit